MSLISISREKGNNVIYVDDIELNKINGLPYPQPFLVGSPVDATDNNGIIITGNTINTEIANNFYGGILSNTTQTIKGKKYFTDGIVSGGLAFPMPYIKVLDVATTGAFNGGSFNVFVQQTGVNMVSCTIIYNILNSIVSAATPLYITGVNFPLALRPSIVQEFEYCYVNSSAPSGPSVITFFPKTYAVGNINTDGSMTLYNNSLIAGGNFVPGTYFNMVSASFVYILDNS